MGHKVATDYASFKNLSVVASKLEVKDMWVYSNVLQLYN